MSTATVHTQQELDDALAADTDTIYIESADGVWFQLTDNRSSHVVARGSSHVVAWGSSHVEARGSSHVVARGSSHVEARESSHVEARGSSHVVARESSHVEAGSSSHVVAWESSHVEARGSSHVEARGSSHVVARGSSHVVARESSHVEARGSSHVVAWESSHVEAGSSSHVVARESSHVVAWESSHVEAGSHVAVHLHSARVQLTGGVVIDVTAVDLADPATWCDYHGVTVTDGIAYVYKATDDNYETGHQYNAAPTSYAPGSTPEAADWADTAYCGGGLHFGPTPSHAKAYRSDATRYLRVGVRLDEMRPITGGGTAKCKAPRVVTPCVEVDLFGQPLPDGDRVGAA